MHKFNNGNGAVVCDLCGKIIREGDTTNMVDICPSCQIEPQVVDNFDYLSDLLIFDDENTFYWVQIIKRRKDNPGMHGDYISYGDYWIFSIEQLNKLKEEIIKTCHTHNARAVLWINRRDSKEITFETASMSLEYYRSKQYKASHALVQHVCGKNRKKNNGEEKIPQLYLVDVDQKDELYINKVVSIIAKCSYRGFEISGIIPTIHGYHIICNGFNLNRFEQELAIEKLGHIDVHKDNPTVLYFNPKW